MRTTAAVKVDAQRFKSKLEALGLTAANMSRELGYSDGYISRALCVGAISSPAAKAIEAVYHISPEDYAPGESSFAKVTDEKEVMAEPITCSEISYAVEQALLKVMPELAVAVKMAIADVLKEFADTYRIYKVGGVQTICPKKESGDEQRN